VAKDLWGNVDENPSIITITISHDDPDYSEDRLKKDEPNIIERGDKIKVVVPEGALGEDDILRISKVSHNEVPPKENPIGVYIKIELESGKTTFYKPIAISLPYPDEDNNGIVDGKGILEGTLKVNVHRAGKWEELPTTIDEKDNIATANTTHLSIFGIFGSYAQDLKDVVIWPNPFRPKKDGFITFSNLPQNATIRIYNVAGELIIEEEIKEARWEWNGRSSTGEQVPTGCYIFIIIKENGEKKIGKVVVIW
jgi:hypothetical protein